MVQSFPDRARRRSAANGIRSWFAAGLGLVAVASVGAAPVEPPGELPVRLPVALVERSPVVKPASQAPPRARLSLRAPETDPGFFDGHLMPRLEGQFLRVLPIYLESGIGSNSHADRNVLYDDLTSAARRRAFKGVKRAFEDYLLETTPLVRLQEKLEVRRSKVRKATSAGGERSSISFSAEIVHARPRLELRYARGSNLFGFRLDGSGEAGVEYRTVGRDLVRVYAGYDFGDDEYGVNCRIRF